MGYNKYGHDITDNQSQTSKQIQSSKAISQLPFKSAFYQHVCISWVSTGLTQQQCLRGCEGLLHSGSSWPLSFMSFAPIQPTTKLPIYLPHDTHERI